MNERDPYFLLTLSALDTPPQRFPPPVPQAGTAEMIDEDDIQERLRDALRRHGYKLS